MDLTKFHKNAKFFEDNREKLFNLYYGKYALISEEAVVAVYDTSEEAYYTGVREYGLGNFYMKRCVPLDEETVVKITGMLIIP